MAKGKLYLIPSVISDGSENSVIPPQVREQVSHIQHFLAEDIRTARRFLSSLKIFADISVLEFSPLSKDTQETDLAELMRPVMSGMDMGVLSDAGCPGIADPGALAVTFAHQHGILVIPLVGPSSLLLALMSSGLSGQQFAFHGYLPIDEKEMIQAIKELERESKIKRQTQLFIETPYRNNRLLGILTRNLHEETRLCIAIDLTSPQQQITTKTIRDWKRDLKVELPKSPAVFLFLA